MYVTLYVDNKAQLAEQNRETQEKPQLLSAPPELHGWDA